MARGKANGNNEAGLPIAYDAELAKMAEAYKSSEAASATGQFISFRGGQMTFRGAPVQGNKLDVVILASVFENVWYENEFDPNQPDSPSCYAFADSAAELRPHEQAKNRQGDDNGTCEGCWANGWGSDPKGGRGKACRNTRRLAVISARPLDAESVAKSEIAYLKLPVTSVNAYSSHAMQVADVLKKPPLGVVTTIGVEPDAKNQFRVTFSVAAEIKDKALLGALIARARAARASMVFPYPELTEAAPQRGRQAAQRPAQRPVRPAQRQAPAAKRGPKY